MDDLPDPSASSGADPWHVLRRTTAARIALGHSGVSQQTQVQLDFQLAHAVARDAVHTGLDAEALAGDLATAWPELSPALLLRSAAGDRSTYLRRPDLGRRLDDASRARLAASGERAAQACDLALVIADGLSALAVARNAAPLLRALRAQLMPLGWTVGPPCIVEQGRVAIGDAVGELLRGRMVLVLIGERPGLSAPDSMGAYLTWAPRVGLTDESRNCVSNIRPAGQAPRQAAVRLYALLGEAMRRGLTGVGLKDDSEDGSEDGGGALAADGMPPFLL